MSEKSKCQAYSGRNIFSVKDKKQLCIFFSSFPPQSEIKYLAHCRLHLRIFLDRIGGEKKQEKETGLTFQAHPV